jgi:hypothetical protein
MMFSDYCSVHKRLMLQEEEGEERKPVEERGVNSPPHYD